jgi:RNA polymerase sigma-70 factor (ECF subfamily)
MDAAARRRLGVNLVRLAGGDREAFDEVFTTLWPPLLALARRLLGNDSEAEDAAQEGLMKVLGNVEQYDASRDALSWAFAITAFEAQTLRKRRARRRETALPVRDPAAAPTTTPEAQLGQAELQARLAEAVDLLSDSDRQEISLYLGLAPPAPSGALDAAHRKRRQRALDRLRTLWRTLHGFHP